MKIAIVGMTALLGEKIASECKKRGMDVTILTGAEEYQKLKKDFVGQFDVLVDATDWSSLSVDEREDAKGKSENLADLMCELPEVRYVVTGDAGMLYVDGTKRACVGKRNVFHAGLVQMPSNWTCFTPAEKFLAEGEKTGAYVLGREIRILNSLGESSISYDDFALALVDELEQKHFIRKKCTAVSDTSAYQMNKELNLIDMTNGSGTTFKAAGAYFGIFADNTGKKRSGLAYQSGKLKLVSRRAMPGDVPGNSFDLLNIYPLYQGEQIGFAVKFAPTELKMVTAYGDISITYADANMMYIKGENGLGLKVEQNMKAKDCYKKRAGKAWEGVYRWRCSLLLNPLEGNLEMNAQWNRQTQSTPHIEGMVIPNVEGEFLLAIQESVAAAMERESYPTYEEAYEKTTADWESFLAKIPEFTPELAIARKEAAWIEWSSLLEPSGFLKRKSIFMTLGTMASSWQMTHQAVALHHDFELATELLVNMIDNIGKRGQFSDFILDGQNQCQGLHPTTQGWALKWLMGLHDFKTEMPRETLEYLYDGYGQWANWFTKYRDDDNDGLPQFDDGDESGYDDASPFVDYPDIEGADIAAYVACSFDALGDVAEILGRDEEAKKWHERADEMIQKMIETYWNGEKFIALRNHTHEVIDSECITDYMPIILGKKLPQEIIDKMTADLLVEGTFLSNVGLATEKITSDQFRQAGFSRGFALPQANLMILTGLYMAGKKDEAKMIATRYSNGMINRGIAQFLNPVNEWKATFNSSWVACGFIALADMAFNM
ncbi:MAG: hypothetical protein MJ092_00785 [Lachnospiraceae bacterium]|nr:hypothetical protein [Lachnospiraceae bacterium]